MYNMQGEAYECCGAKTYHPCEEITGFGCYRSSLGMSVGDFIVGGFWCDIQMKTSKKLSVG